VTLSPLDRPREVVIPELVARWTAYSQLPKEQRAAVDDRRLLPVPETCQLLADYFRAQMCNECGEKLHQTVVRLGYPTCRACRRLPMEAA
jgi:hypothetical protein